MIVHSSDLTSYSRCAAAYGYRKAGVPDKPNSAMAYGSVMHAAIEALERMRAEGVPFDDAVQRAVATFLHFWHPMNIEAVCDPVPPDGWLPSRSYGELRDRGVLTIRGYADMIKGAPDELLALEYGFALPIEGTWDDQLGEPHVLAGTMDRLAVGRFRRHEILKVVDFKTSVKKPEALRHHVQFSTYAMATTYREFWVGWGGEDGFGPERGEALYRRFHGRARRCTWVDLHQLKFVDAGWRGPLDYQRLVLAIEQFVDAVRHEVYPLSISGENCLYCPSRGVCGGGLPEKTHGEPS